MTAGDHLVVRRFVYTHHGIDCGDGLVIHFSGEPGRKAAASIVATSRADFTRGGAVTVRRYGRRFDGQETVERARSMLGATDYNLFNNNCEHFATWCATGMVRSGQVQTAVAGTGVATAGGAGALASPVVVSTVGAVTGTSGPGIMSGLAAIGSVVGGGAAVGLLLVAAVPATVSTVFVGRAMQDDDTYAAHERAARSAGRGATKATAAAATLGSVALVSAAGSVGGLSAAGISSGLAAIGAWFGGGMLAGVIAAAAVPAILAAIVGYGVYRHVRGGHERVSLPVVVA